MFAPPEQLKTEVFTRIPDRFLTHQRHSEWAHTQLHGAQAPVFLEGPSFDRDGNLWVVDIPWGRIFRIDPKGQVELVLEYDGEPNGLKFHPDGRAFIADCRNGIMVMDPRTGHIEPYLERARLERQLWDAFERGEPIEQLVEQCEPGFQKEVWSTTAVRIRKIEEMMRSQQNPKG